MLSRPQCPAVSDFHDNADSSTVEVQDAIEWKIYMLEVVTNGDIKEKKPVPKLIVSSKNYYCLNKRPQIIV